jgi:hypothetical protein
MFLCVSLDIIRFAFKRLLLKVADQSVFGPGLSAQGNLLKAQRLLCMRQ